MAEFGITDDLSKRHVKSQSNCHQNKRKKGSGLNFEFFTSLFVFYLFSLMVCLVIFFFENVFKPYKSRIERRSSLEDLKQELQQKTETFIKDITNPYNDLDILADKTLKFTNDLQAIIELKLQPNNFSM